MELTIIWNHIDSNTYNFLLSFPGPLRLPRAGKKWRKLIQITGFSCYWVKQSCFLGLLWACVCLNSVFSDSIQVMLWGTQWVFSYKATDAVTGSCSWWHPSWEMWLLARSLTLYIHWWNQIWWNGGGRERERERGGDRKERWKEDHRTHTGKWIEKGTRKELEVGKINEQ